MKRAEQMLKEKNEKSKKRKVRKPKVRTVPTYDKKGKDITPGKKEKDRRIAILLLVLSAIILFIYLPGFFMGEPYVGEVTRQAVAPDGSAIKKMTTVVRSNTEEDFDNDEINNADEEKYGTDLWNADTDGDGAYDLYEINVSKTDPTKYDNSVLVDVQTKMDEEKGVNVGTPYKINGVTLWAADYTSKAHGSVVPTTKGYRFSNFTGYAQFPEGEGNFAYRVINGTREALNFREAERVWEIHPNDTVELYNVKLEDTVEFKLFSKVFYITSNRFTRGVAWILPDTGLVTAKVRMKKDVEPDTSEPVTANIKKPVYNSDDGDRFMQNTNTLEMLQHVRKSIEEKDTTFAVSLFNRNYGEFIAIVYGYTQDGNLLLADIDTLQPIGVLGITERANKVVTNKGEMLSRTYFDFDGFGFHSYNGDRICFFASSAESINGNFDNAGKTETQDTVQKEEAQEPEAEDAAGTAATTSEEPAPEKEGEAATDENAGNDAMAEQEHQE